MRRVWLAFVVLAGCGGGRQADPWGCGSSCSWFSCEDSFCAPPRGPQSQSEPDPIDDARSETFLADGESDAFFLCDRPDLSTLVVVLPEETLAVDDGAAYDEAGNAVLLDEPPADGTEVTVEYVLLDPAGPVW